MLNKQIKIGITGGTGCGKSTVCSIFSDLNTPIYCADREAKLMMQNDIEIILQIIHTFGMESYTIPQFSDKSESNFLAYLKTDYLGNLVFNNPEKLSKLNNIVHPKLIKHFHNWCLENKLKFIILDSALIFETELKNHLDYIICVSSPIDIRIERLMKRDNLSKEMIIKRMESQLSEENKIINSHFTIVNDNIQKILPQILSILEKIYQKENSLI